MADIKQTLDLDIKSYVANMKKAEQAQVQFAKKSTAAGKDAGEGFKGGAREAERAWDRSGSRIERALTNIKRLVVGAFAIDMIRRFGTAMVSVAQQTEQLNIRFNALTGSATVAAQKLGEIQRFAQSNGLSFAGLAKGVQIMSSFGMSLDEVMQNLDAISTAALLSPDGMEAGMERIGRALGQIKGNGRLAAEEMNQLTEAGLPAWKMLAESMGVSVAHLRKMSKEGKVTADVAIGGIMDGLRKSYPMLLKEYAKSGEGMGNRFKETFRKSIETLGSDVWGKMKRDMGALSVSLNNLEASGSLGGALKEISKALGDVYEILKKIAAVVAPLTPDLIRFGVSLGAMKITGSIIGGWSAMIGKMKDFKTALEQVRATGMYGGALPTYKWPENITVSRVRELEMQIAQGRGGFMPKAHGASEAEMAAYWQSAGQQMRGAKNQLDELRLAQGQVTTRMGRMAVRAKMLGRTMAGAFSHVKWALGGWPGIIMAIAGALVFLAQKFDWFKRKLDAATEAVKRHRDEIKGLLTDLDELDPAAKGTRLVELTVKWSEMKVEEAKILGDLPENIQEAIKNAIATGAIDGLSQAASQSSINPAQWGMGAGAAGAMVAQGARTLSRFGLEPGDITPDVRQAIQNIKDLRDAMAQTQQGQRELTASMAGDYHQQLAYYQGMAHYLNGIVDKTPEQIAQIEAVRKKIEEINEALGYGSSAPTPIPEEPEKWSGMTLLELKHAMEMLEAAEELKSKLGEVHAIREEIAQVEAERDEYAKRSDASQGQIQDYNELLRLLEAELDLKTASYNKSYDLFELYNELPRHAQEMVGSLEAFEQLFSNLSDSIGPNAENTFLHLVQQLKQMPKEAARFIEELGGLEELTKSGQGIGTLTEMLLPDLQDVTAWSNELSYQLADVQRKIDLKIITEEKGREEAERYALAFTDRVKALLERYNLDVLPEPFRRMFDDMLNGFISTIGANTTSDAEKQVKAYEKLAEALEKAAQNMRSLVDTGRGFVQLASLMKILGRSTEALVSSLLDAADGFTQMKEKQAEIARINADRAAEGLGALGAGSQALMMAPVFVGMATSMVSAFQGFSEATNRRREEAKQQAEEHARRLRDMADALRNYQRQIERTIEQLFGGGRSGSGLRESQIKDARSAMDALNQWLSASGSSDGGPRGGIGRGTTPPNYSGTDINQARDLLSDLMDTGVFDLDVVGLFDELLELSKGTVGGSGDLQAVMGEILFGRGGRGSASDPDNFEGISSVLARLEKEFADFTEDLDGAIEQVSFFAKFMGEDAIQQFERFLGVLLDESNALYDKLDGDLVAILTKAKSLNLNDPAGREELKKIIQTIALGFHDYMGDLTSEVLEQILGELQRVYDESGGEAEYSRSVQYLRTITEAQGNELVILLKEISWYVRRIAETMNAVSLPTTTLHVPSIPTAQAYTSASTAGARYTVNVGGVHVSVEDWNRLAETVSEKLYRTLSAKQRRPF